VWLGKADRIELLLIFAWVFILAMELFAGAWFFAVWAGCVLGFLVTIVRARIGYDSQDPQ